MLFVFVTDGAWERLRLRLVDDLLVSAGTQQWQSVVALGHLLGACLDANFEKNNFPETLIFPKFQN